MLVGQAGSHCEGQYRNSSSNVGAVWMEVVDAAADEDCLDTIELLGDELGDELSDGLRTELGLEFEPVGSEGCTSSSWRRSSIRPTGGRLRSITISPFRASLARVDF